MRKIVLLLIVMTALTSSGQTSLKNSSHALELPKATVFEKMNSTKEETSNVDVYKITLANNDQPKYLIYLMKNKLNKEINSISDYNFEDYLKDVGKAEILSKDLIIFKNREYYKVKVDFGNKVQGVLYITVKDDNLYRLLFMLPNSEYYVKYSKEITSIFESSSLL
ncbi:hypothetical protein ATO12_19370 [Aquimarina atlantica]|uniref:PsbP C-terminal domain-containing protein n=1 Tax=Aquimarina atlantica TaxID=1317122 RepID=A0A023BTQ5_9FLAO|nr:hypothetical protein [Aquimarina atlantica]EZH73168.1 hypothetical protein ATO12_19370 [Aquimarina atlantica]